MSSSAEAAGVLNLVLGGVSLAVLASAVHNTAHGPLVGQTLALGLGAALALLLYGVALVAVASTATVNLAGYVFLVLFASALVLAVPLVLMSKTFPRKGRLTADVTWLTVLTLAVMALIMYWEGGSVLGFISPFFFVLAAISLCGISGFRYRRTHSIVYAVLLLLSAFLLLAALFFCLGSESRRDWLWGVALALYTANVTAFVRYLPDAYRDKDEE